MCVCGGSGGGGGVHALNESGTSPGYRGPSEKSASSQYISLSAKIYNVAQTS